MNEINQLLNKVVENDYCIGCGACASMNNSPLSMKLTSEGKYKPYLKDNIQYNEERLDVLSVCPFSDHSKNETEIGEYLFANNEQINFQEYTGYYLKNYAGYVKEGDFRKRGSSGGMGNWISIQLLKRKLVDGIIHVKPVNDTNTEDVLFEYQISFTEEELVKGAKSKYYPIELSKVMQMVKEQNMKFALIGIPCYIKAVRLLAEQDELIKSRIKYFIGLVCGHLKSDMFAKSIGWQLGINPNNLIKIDFRKKLIDRPASEYGVEVEGQHGDEIVNIDAARDDLYVTNWGYGFFKYNACEYCDDILAETADITVGDAWLPEYKQDSLGTNIITVRNPVLQKVIEENNENLHLQEIDTEKVYQSQSGGFRHRREGLAYRLYLKDCKNEWRPKKRVDASKKISLKRKNIYQKRTMLFKESFKAYREAEKVGDFKIFTLYMEPLIRDYKKLVGYSLLKKIVYKLQKGFSIITRN